MLVDVTLQNDAGPSELEIQMEVERLVVEEFASDQQMLASHPDILEIHHPESTPGSHRTAPISSTRNTRRSRKKGKARYSTNPHTYTQ